MQKEALGLSIAILNILQILETLWSYINAWVISISIL